MALMAHSCSCRTLSSRGVARLSTPCTQRLLITFPLGVRTASVWIAACPSGNQQAGESTEKYITALYHLVEMCEYGEFQAEMLRDRIVVGMRDVALSERLQIHARLTLDGAKRELRQKEAVQQQQQQQQQLQAEAVGRLETLESVSAAGRVHGGRSLRSGRSKGGAVTLIKLGHDGVILLSIISRNVSGGKFIICGFS